MRIISTKKQIEIGKEAYEAFINSSGDSKVLDEIASKYHEDGITWGDVRILINLYHKRVLGPKPTIDQKRVFEFLMSNDNGVYTVHQIMQSEKPDLDKLLNISIIDNPVLDNNDKTPSVVDTMKPSKRATGVFQKDTKERDIREGIIAYLDSEEVLPDIIMQRYYYYTGSNVRFITDDVKKFGTISEENKKLADEFFATIDERLERFIILIKSIYDKEHEENRRLTLLEIELMLRGDVRIIINSICKFAVQQRLEPLGINKSWSYNLRTYLQRFPIKKQITVDKALEINYKYKDKQMSKDDILDIVLFLQEHRLPITEYNITAVFEEIVKGNRPKSYFV